MVSKKTSVQTKLLQAYASWGSVLAPIGIFFPSTNVAAAKITSKVPYGIGALLGQAQQATGVTSTTTKKKATKKTKASKKAKKATKNKKR